MADLNEIATRIDATALMGMLLDEQWHQKCEIIPDYMPPSPQPDTRPSVKIRFNDGTEYAPFLRYSHGPKQGYFWDIYGDYMHSIELAVFALSQAPAPRSVGPIVFHIPFPGTSDATAQKGAS